MFTLEKDTVEFFEFNIKGSRTKYKVPLISYLPLDLALEAADLENKTDKEVTGFFKNIFNQYEPGISGLLTATEFGKVLRAYFEASNITVGE